MKKPNPLLVFLALVCAMVVFAPRASAQGPTQSILLTVDVSDPANATFTATANGALASDNSHTFFDGFDLYTFFTDPANGFTSETGLPTSLTTSVDGSMVATYDSATFDDISGSEVDLNIYGGSQDGSPTETFTQRIQAFTGTITIDLSGASDLPAPGTIGDIYAGFDSIGGEPSGPTPDGVGTDAITDQVLIGQYVVVPEANPAVLMLVAGAALLIVMQLRRRVA